MTMIYSPKSDISVVRFHALDAGRGLALIIGIIYHSFESLIPFKVYNVAQDTQTSTLLDGLYYVCHIFRMQLFFFMAGFFAHLLYHRGLYNFITNRIKRLVLPFVLFWPINYILVTILWVYNINQISGLPLNEAFTKLPSNFRFVEGFPLMHLWFLYWLILYCFCAVLVHPIINWLSSLYQNIRVAVDQALALIISHWWGGIVLACLTIGPMLKMSGFVGVDTLNSSLRPEWPPFTLYGIYFALGWLLHRQPNLLKNLQKYKIINLTLSILFISILFAFKICYDPSDETTIKWLPLVMSSFYAFASMLSVCAFLGYMLTLFSRQNTVMRYISDSAYWGYLAHYPIVIFFQTLVAPYDWHWLLKLILILSPTFVILLLTYNLFVRRTWLSLLLNGRIYKSIQ